MGPPGIAGKERLLLHALSLLGAASAEEQEPEGRTVPFHIGSHRGEPRSYPSGAACERPSFSRGNGTAVLGCGSGFACLCVYTLASAWGCVSCRSRPLDLIFFLLLLVLTGFRLHSPPLRQRMDLLTFGQANRSCPSLFLTVHSLLTIVRALPYACVSGVHVQLGAENRIHHRRSCGACRICSLPTIDPRCGCRFHLIQKASWTRRCKCSRVLCASDRRCVFLFFFV